MTTTQRWLAGILRALIQGISTGVSVALSQAVATSHTDWTVVGMSMIITGVIRLGEFLTRHPLPNASDLLDEQGATVEMRAVEPPPKSNEK